MFESLFVLLVVVLPKQKQLSHDGRCLLCWTGCIPCSSPQRRICVHDRRSRDSALLIRWRQGARFVLGFVYSFLLLAFDVLDVTGRLETPGTVESLSDSVLRFFTLRRYFRVFSLSFSPETLSFRSKSRLSESP
jgi:hypothetical protein